MQPAAKHWLDYLTGIASLLTPLLVLLLTAVGWKYRQSLERKAKLEERLRDDRIDIYNQILEPFIILLTTEAAWQTDKKHRTQDKNQVAVAKMLSLDYRKVSFKLSLIGSDPVVRAFNDLLQYFYSRGKSGSTPDACDLREMMSLLGRFLLEIRRSMGNEATELDNWNMLEWFMTDARKLRDEPPQGSSA